MPKRFKLRNAGLRIPMPERGRAMFPAGPRGTPVDEASPYYARLIAEGDLVEVKAETAPPAPKADRPPPAAADDGPAPKRRQTEGDK